MTRVHLTAGDDSGWAIDEDLRLLEGALRDQCTFTSLARAEVVHAVWWQRLLCFTRRDFPGKHVLCYADNAPFYYATEPSFLQARELVTLWIARSREAVAQFATLGIESRFAPYTFDPTIFRPLEPDDAQVRALIEKWRIPTDRYLIANFHRDTEGADLRSPKLQKGPDAFLEIVSQLHTEGAPVHVLLAGPRRFYLRNELARRRVPFTFVGEDTAGRDDYKVNILPRSQLNLLYQIADVHLIASRWEGGPHSVLESAAARCKVLSTPVGIAPDVLAPECLFKSVPEACEIIRRDLREKHLDVFTERHFRCVHEHHTEPALRRHLVEIYRSLEPVRTTGSALGATLRRFVSRSRSFFPAAPKPLVIAILHRPADHAAVETWSAPLGTALEERGCTVAHNELTSATNAVILGELPPTDPLRSALAARPDLPVIGIFDEVLRSPRPLDDCTLLPSLDALDALRQQQMLPRRALVLPLPPLDEGSAGAEPKEPLVIPPGDPWVAGRIGRALAQGRAVLYPAESHWGWSVWFAGLDYATPAEMAQRLDNLRAHSALFARMISPGTPPVADRLIRLIRVCQNFSDENRS